MTGAGGPGSRFKGKHSLDSDEEDDDDEGSRKYDILASEDVEGELNSRTDAAGGTDSASGDVGQGRLCLFSLAQRGTPVSLVQVRKQPHSPVREVCGSHPSTCRRRWRKATLMPMATTS